LWERKQKSSTYNTAESMPHWMYCHCTTRCMTSAASASQVPNIDAIVTRWHASKLSVILHYGTVELLVHL
jgi:hypothetical protein